MAEPKTRKTRKSVAKFLREIPDEQQREDAHRIARMMESITGAKPAMWGPSMVGFGEYHYVYASGREGDWFETGFSPRKRELTLYIMSGFAKHDTLMKKLGKYRTGKSCLYIKKLDDVDRGVLRRLIKGSVDYIRKTYG